MGAPDLLQALRTEGLNVQVDGERLLVSPAERITEEIRAMIRTNKAALLEALSRSEIYSSVQESIAVSTAPVVHLRLMLQQDDGTRIEAILAIPEARYDGMRVLELLERHRMAGTTRVISVVEHEDVREEITS